MQPAGKLALISGCASAVLTHLQAFIIPHTTSCAYVLLYKQRFHIFFSLVRVHWSNHHTAELTSRTGEQLLASERHF
jgi:hypothetical protein